MEVLFILMGTRSISCSGFERREHRIPEAPIIPVVDIDNTVLLLEKIWKILRAATRQWMVFHNLESDIQDVVQDQARASPVVVGIAEEYDVLNFLEHGVDVQPVEYCMFA